MQDFVLKRGTLSLTEEYYNRKSNNIFDNGNDSGKEDYDHFDLIDEKMLDDISYKSSCCIPMHTPGLHLAFRLLLPLSVSQVSCHRTFLNYMMRKLENYSDEFDATRITGDSGRT